MGNLRAQRWYNGKNVEHLRGYLNDTSTRLLGWATMRQLRITAGRCASEKMSSICREDYSRSNEERGSFSPGWLARGGGGEEIFSPSISQSFLYKSSKDLNSYVYVGDHGQYSGGGYVYAFRGHLSALRSNLSALHRLGWIDQQTRAVFIQLSLYNPNVQLFTSVTFLTEFLATGSIHSQARFEPIHVYGSLLCSVRLRKVVVLLF